jgi:hypothetical protein
MYLVNQLEFIYGTEFLFKQHYAYTSIVIVIGRQTRIVRKNCVYRLHCLYHLTEKKEYSIFYIFQ